MLARRGPLRPDLLRTAPSTGPERRLSAAAVAARAASVQRVAAVLGGFDVDRLAATTDGAVLSVLRVDPAAVAALAAQACWDGALADQPGPAPQVLVVPAGSPEPRPLPDAAVRAGRSDVESAVLVPGALAAQLDAGATLVLNRVDQFDRGALRALCEDLERCFGVAVGTNAYVSRNAARGFGRHWDDHDVLVVQVEGRKMWEVFEPVALSPQRGVVPDDAVGRAVWSGLLGPGDALWVPRGWGHRTISIDGLSVHYTISVHRPTVVTALEALAASPVAAPVAATDAGVAGWLADLLADPTQLVDRALASTWGEIGARCRDRTSLADRVLVAATGGAEGVAAGGSASAAHGRGAGVAPLWCTPAPAFCGPPGEGSVRLRWSGADVELSAAEAEVLAAAVDPGSGHGSVPAADPLARALLHAGLGRPVEPAPERPAGPDGSADVVPTAAVVAP